jgi:hypothetical protein
MMLSPKLDGGRIREPVANRVALLGVGRFCAIALVAVAAISALAASWKGPLLGVELGFAFCGVLVGYVLPRIAVVALLAALSISPAVGSSLHFQFTDANAVQKTFVAAVAIGLLAAFGWGRSRSASVFVGLWLVAFAASFAIKSSHYVTTGGTIRAFLGFASPWLLALVAFDGRTKNIAVQSIRSAAPFAVLIGLILQWGWGWPLLRHDAGGVLRLEGSLIPPHLAMLGVAGLIASLPRRDGVWPRSAQFGAAINGLIIVATLTRGAAAVAAGLTVVLLLTVLRTPKRRASRWKVLGATLAVCVIVAAAFTAQLAKRDVGNSYEGGFNTSGRIQAWHFYGALAEKRPWSGYGLGTAAVANEVDHPTGVQEIFAAPHNEYIHLALDTGIPLGAALTVSFLFLCGIGASKHVGLVGGIGVVLVFTVYLGVDNVLSTPQMTGPLALIIGVWLAPSQIDSHSPNGIVGRPREPARAT